MTFLMEIIGWVATVLINIAYFPQLIHTIKTKQVNGLNKWMYIILIFASVLWIIYSYSLGSIPILICNIINLISSSIILGLILKYQK